jgi:hypothetical protein
MVTQNHLRNIFLYFSQFVAPDVLIKNYRQPMSSQLPGYADLVAEVAANADPSRVLPEIRTFIFSINEKYLSDVMKNASGAILFVEYGKISLNKGVAAHTQESSLAVSVASDFTICNNDVLQELLVQQKNLDTLNSILIQMNKDIHTYPGIGSLDLLAGNIDINPIDPKNFYDKGGWSASFSQSRNVI